MTPDDVALVRAQAAELRGDPRLGRAFHEHLFADTPELRSLFGRDPGTLQRRFVAELDALVRMLGDPDAFAHRTEALGRMHAGYGVAVEHYDLARAALLAALGDVLGDRLDDAAREAWSAAFDLVADTMLAGHEE